LLDPVERGYALGKGRAGRRLATDEDQRSGTPRIR
jgi:hypothetical protein